MNTHISEEILTEYLDGDREFEPKPYVIGPTYVPYCERS